MEKFTDSFLTEEKEMITGSQLMLRGDFDESKKFLLAAIKKLEKDKATNISFALSVDGLGQLYLRQNMLEEARSKFEQVVKIYEKYFPEFKIGLFLTLINLASALELQDSLGKSEKRLKQAMTMVNGFYNDETKNLIEIFAGNYTRVLEKLNKYDESEKVREDIAKLLAKSK